jgi:AhpD family alkylhydroperoxidase
MKLLRHLAAYLRVFSRARRNRADLFRWYGRRPLLLGGMLAYETGGVFSNRLDPRLKLLAAIKVTGMVGCAFCMDLAGALGRATGISDDELRDLSRYGESDRFGELERLALDLTVAVTSTPAGETETLRAQLLEHLTKGQLAELVAAIAWENHWARMNHALGVRPAGFSDGAYCVVPERPAPADTAATNTSAFSG